MRLAELGADWGLTSHNLPNGAFAAVDSNDKLVAYCKTPKEGFTLKSSGDRWDWVRKDCQKKSRKRG
jgi:hypothetical protein